MATKSSRTGEITLVRQAHGVIPMHHRTTSLPRDKSSDVAILPPGDTARGTNWILPLPNEVTRFIQKSRAAIGRLSDRSLSLQQSSPRADRDPAGHGSDGWIIRHPQHTAVPAAVPP